MPRSKPSKMTQRTIAELAGVSQATVSLVMSGRTDTTTRISDVTRGRVLEVIAKHGYAVDPAARTLAGKSNNLIGVFTYESAFPAETSDFYAPLLHGVESAAEELRADLLMFTSSSVVKGRRSLLREGSRLRMADGCVLLGRDMDAGELTRLVEMGFPFVAVGRRDGDRRIPFVGADYAAAVAEIVDVAVAHGHTRFLYLRLPSDAESTRDRLEGFAAAVTRHHVSAEVEALERDDMEAQGKRARDAGVTVIFIEDPADAEQFAAVLERQDLVVPRDLSIVALGDHHVRSGTSERTFTRLVAPRSALGAGAVHLLARIMREGVDVEFETRVLLPCSIVAGDTLADIR